MAYPNPPTKATSYTAFEQAQGDGSFPGQEMDVDLASILASISSLLEFIRVALRSDGQLNNGIVTRLALASDIVLGFAPPTEWETATEYQAIDTVFYQNKFYICTVAHTSSVFATDLASGRWDLLVDISAAGALVAGNNLSDLGDAATARTNLGLGALALLASPLGVANGGTGGTTQATARTGLGLGSAATGNIGSTVQAYNATLQALSGLTTTAYGRAVLAWADAAAGRTALGLGSFATLNTVDRILDLPTWKTGTDTTEALITPDKLAKTINGRMYESAEVSLSTGTQYVLTHGLGVIPDFVTVELVCTTADAGYSVGQRIEVATTGSSNAGVSVRKTDASVVVRVGSSGPGGYIRDDTFASANLTAGSWSMVVRAFRFS